MSKHWEKRLENLKSLVTRAKKHGISIYLYLNEPRFQPLTFFGKHSDLKGVTIGNQAALCTSHPDVQQYLADSLAIITERIPDLGGFFSITASENPTNCWSHGQGGNCPRCSKLGPAVVISKLNGLYLKGIENGIKNYEVKSGRKFEGKNPELIVWDWGWADAWAEQIIPILPKKVALMSVSEWDLEIERGGVKSRVGEYSISGIGPGPRALRNWKLARENGLKTIAKIQAGNTWEIAAVPYIPAIQNVATHAAHLRNTKVDGLMLGWTLGGHPSPNLEVVAAIGNDPNISVSEAMEKVAKNRFGAAYEHVVQAWKDISIAFSEFPYNGSTVYNAPLQSGPSNLLWEKPTGYAATMVGIAYDDVMAWRSIYPIEIFIMQMRKVSTGFLNAITTLKQKTNAQSLAKIYQKALSDECNIAETIAIHYSSVANQAQFITLRENFGTETDKTKKLQSIDLLKRILDDEIDLAKRMHALQQQDSRLGFEATNHYFYIPDDLVEKIINCYDLRDRWLVELKQSLE